MAEEASDVVNINNIMEHFIAYEAAEVAAEGSFINNEFESVGGDGDSDLVFVGETYHTSEKRRMN